MYYHAGRLVDDDEVIILEHHVQWDRHRPRRGRRWRRNLNNPSVTWPYFGGRISGRFAIAIDVALGDQGLDSGP